jgi:hypothetical protein
MSSEYKLISSTIDSVRAFYSAGNYAAAYRAIRDDLNSQNATARQSGLPRPSMRILSHGTTTHLKSTTPTQRRVGRISASVIRHLLARRVFAVFQKIDGNEPAAAGSRATIVEHGRSDGAGFGHVVVDHGGLR